MCLAPTKIYSPHRFLPIGFSQHLTIPCGKCQECADSKRLSWTFRSYWQAQDVLKHKGFVLFDTLTYNEQSLPHYKGVPCFSPRDIALFFKRLRKGLNSLGLDVGGKRDDGSRYSNLGYFLTCEYGDQFHRPHYHVLFFSKIPGLAISDFKRLINRCWPHGFCDSWKTLQQHTFRVQSKSMLDHLHYVTSYVGKHLDFDEAVRSAYPDIEPRDLKTYREEVGPFIRVSKGYGLYCLDMLDHDDILNCRGYFDTPQKVRQEVSLCLYYKRKLYYDIVPLQSSDGETHKVYVLNKLGYQYLTNNFNSLTQSLAGRYFETFLSLYQCDKDKINFLLNGRKFIDLAYYHLSYRDRIEYLLTMDPLQAFLSHYTLTMAESPWQSEDDAIRKFSRSRWFGNIISQYSSSRFADFDTILNILENRDAISCHLKNVHYHKADLIEHYLKFPFDVSISQKNNPPSEGGSP